MSLLSAAAEAEAAIADDTSARTTEFGEPLTTSVRVMPVVAMGKVPWLPEFEIKPKC